ncbi:hypothetical protein N7522_004171 [Penicillium canescens]|nr:hypothetical protein N7522_004171 [Penicillium canescens]
MAIDTSGKTAVNIAYINGNVLTSSSGPPAQAILIRDGRIAAVGSNEKVLTAGGRNVEVQDVSGATISPGLIDTHPHLLHYAAARAPLVNILDAKSHDDIVKAISEKASSVPKGAWIATTPIGDAQYFARRSYRDLEGGMPNRYVLDRASINHPIIIQAWPPTCPNITAFNSLALQLLGIDSSTADRVNDVWIEKDSQGEPTGILKGSVNTYYNEDPFFAELRDTKMAPYIVPNLIPQAVLSSLADYHKRGITSIFEAHAMESSHIEVYKRLHDEGKLNTRVLASTELESNALPGSRLKSMSEIVSTLEQALAARQSDNDWLRVEGITTCVWGIPTHDGLCWKECYQATFGGLTTGKRNITKEKLRATFEFCAKTGLRLNLLSTSPDELDEYIETAEAVMKKYNIKKSDWLIEHAMIIREGQAKKLKELGFSVTINIGHTYGLGDVLDERVGKKSLEGLNAIRELLDAGLIVGACLDWGPMDPWECMQLSVTHQMFPSGRFNDGPRQVISRAEAFELFTTHGAGVMQWEGIGTLMPGSHADLIIIDRNPLTCDLDSLSDTKVLRTTVAGRIVYDNGEIGAKV